MNIDTGDKCVCVDGQFDDADKALYVSLPIENSVYVVRDVAMGFKTVKGKRLGLVRLLLVGLNNPLANPEVASSERGFNSDRFRRLDEVQEQNAIEKHVGEFVAEQVVNAVKEAA